MQEILTVSRMESSGFALRKEPTDLAALMRELHADFEDLLVHKGLRWSERLAGSAVVLADRCLLKKALGNLAGNAVSYSPSGNGIYIELRSSGGETLLSIENTGVHIPEDDLPRLFDAFYRVEASRSRETGGSGLGLYIVKRILDAHGAQYRMENTVAGVRFTVRFAG